MARAVRIHERGSDNPLFAEVAMDLGRLSIDDPRMYSVADLGNHNRRRWRALAEVGNYSLVADMFAANFAEYGDARYATYLVTSQFSHSVLGRAVASFVHRGRVWDPHVSNLFVRTNTEWGFDWVGVDDPVVRVLPDDARVGTGLSRAELVVLPGEAEMAYWLAGRAVSALDPVFALLASVSLCRASQMWATAARESAYTAVSAARLGETSRDVAERRVQLLLDALEVCKIPVRRTVPLPCSLMGSRHAPELEFEDEDELEDEEEN